MFEDQGLKKWSARGFLLIHQYLSPCITYYMINYMVKSICGSLVRGNYCPSFDLIIPIFNASKIYAPLFVLAA